MVTRVAPPSTTRPIVNEDGTPSTQTRIWMETLTNRALIISTGSPEGVVEANQGAEYMDDAGVAGAIKYIKRDADVTGDKTKGWILV